MASFTVVYDACVLYPAPLRDFLMHLALTDMFMAKWSQRIHDEWTRALRGNRPDISEDDLTRTRTLMDSSVRDCLVTDYEDLVPSINLPDDDDRHVVAVAIVSGAATIVTFNLADFPASELNKYGMEAQHPDDFVICQLGLSESLVCGAAKKHRASLKLPPKTVDEYLITMENQGLPRSAARLRQFADLL